MSALSLTNVSNAGDNAVNTYVSTAVNVAANTPSQGVGFSVTVGQPGGPALGGVQGGARYTALNLRGVVVTEDDRKFISSLIQRLSNHVADSNPDKASLDDLEKGCVLSLCLHPKNLQTQHIDPDKVKSLLKGLTEALQEVYAQIEVADRGDASDLSVAKASLLLKGIAYCKTLLVNDLTVSGSFASKTLQPLNALLSETREVIAVLQTQEPGSIPVAAATLGKLQASFAAQKADVAQLAREGKDTKAAQKALDKMEKSIGEMSTWVAAAGHHAGTMMTLQSQLAAAKEQLDNLNHLEVLGQLPEGNESAALQATIASLTQQIQKAGGSQIAAMARVNNAARGLLEGFEKISTLVSKNEALLTGAQNSTSKWEVFKGLVATVTATLGIGGAVATGVALFTLGVGLTTFLGLAGLGVLGVGGVVGLGAAFVAYKKFAASAEAKAEGKQVAADFQNFNRILKEEITALRMQDEAYMPEEALLGGYAGLTSGKLNGVSVGKLAQKSPEIAARVLLSLDQKIATKVLHQMEEALASGILASMAEVYDEPRARELLLSMPSRHAADILEAGDPGFAAFMLSSMHANGQTAAAGMICSQWVKTREDGTTSAQQLESILKLAPNLAAGALHKEAHAPLPARLMKLDPAMAARELSLLNDGDTVIGALSQLGINTTANILAAMDPAEAADILVNWHGKDSFVASMLLNRMPMATSVGITDTANAQLNELRAVAFAYTQAEKLLTAGVSREKISIERAHGRAAIDFAEAASTGYEADPSEASKRLFLEALSKTPLQGDQTVMKGVIGTIGRSFVQNPARAEAFQATFMDALKKDNVLDLCTQANINVTPDLINQVRIAKFNNDMPALLNALPVGARVQILAPLVRVLVAEEIANTQDVDVLPFINPFLEACGFEANEENQQAVIDQIVKKATELLLAQALPPVPVVAE